MKENVNFTISDFIILLLSYYKINGIDKIDVVQTCYALTTYYYSNKYGFLFQDFKLRKNKEYQDIIDIDGALSHAYLFNILSDDRTINLDEEVIKNDILPKYDKNVNQLMSELVEEVINRLPLYESSNENFTFHLFYNSKSGRK